MQQLKNKTVFISGASSGIGEACAIEFAKLGSRLILCARRKERLEKLSSHLKSSYNSEVLLLELDVRDNNAIKNQINNLSSEWEKIDILVNNAGLSRGLDLLHEGEIQDWEEMIDTNVKGLLYMSRSIIPGMVERAQGDIINIGSIAGHEVYQKGNVYCATKHAVDAITKGMRIDLLGTEIRVCTIDPGLVETEFSEVRFRGDNKRAKTVYKGFKPLSANDIADCVIYAVSRPKHVQIAEMIVLPTDQRSATNVFKNNQ